MNIRFLVFCFALLLFFALNLRSYANVSSCNADVDLHSVVKNTANDFTFTIDNTDSANFNRILITRPSASIWTINGGSGDGFTSEYNSNDITFYAGSLDSGSSTTFTVNASVSNFTSDSTAWTVEVSDDDGESYFSCLGDLGTAVVNPPADEPPQIVELTLSNITSSSITLNWTTDKSTIGYVDYGITDEYGQTKEDLVFSESHSVTITSLSANTKYHFNIRIEDANSLSGQWGDDDFTTASVGESVTITVEKTTTKTITPTPTPTPLPDTTKPTVSLTTNFSKPFSVPPQVLGTAKDNKDISKIEYSLDNGKNWIPVDKIASVGKLSTSFSFIPSALDDGNYLLKARATDSSGNIGITKSYTLIIDRLSPQVSGLLFSLGPQVLVPKKDGSIFAIAGQEIKLTLSDVGGATSIDVFADDTLKLDSNKFTLSKNTQNGLWSSNLNFKKVGKYQLRFSAIDGAGNKTDRNLNTVFVVDKGFVFDTANNHIKDAKITVYYLEPKSNTWQIWDSSAYLQENPLKTDSSGNYSLLLPSGKFYMHIDANGFQSLDSSIFSLNTPSPINADFSLKPLKLLFSLGPIKFYLPDFSIHSAPFVNNLPKLTLQANKLYESQLPFFNLNGFSTDSILGKPSVLTFLNLWSPSSLEQISILNDLHANKNINFQIIVEGEKASRVDVFKKRGEYAVPMITDQDATLVNILSLNVLPTHYFLDRKGVVKEVISGVLSKEELANILISNSQ